MEDNRIFWPLYSIQLFCVTLTYPSCTCIKNNFHSLFFVVWGHWSILLTDFGSWATFDRDGPKCFETTSVGLFGVAVFVLGHAFCALPCCLQSALDIVIWLKESYCHQRWGEDFLTSWAPVQPFKGVWLSRFPGMFWSFSKPSVDISVPVFFFFSQCFGQPLVCTK